MDFLKLCHKGWLKPLCVPIILNPILTVLLVLLLTSMQNAQETEPSSVKPESSSLHACQQTCKLSLVESTPQGLQLPDLSIPTTFSIWSKMIEEATDSIEIASFYWSLRDMDVAPQSERTQYPRKYNYQPMLNDRPTEQSSQQSTEQPTHQPTQQPTHQPTQQTSEQLDQQPTHQPTQEPTEPCTSQRPRFPGSDEGEIIFSKLVEAGTTRKLKLKIAQDLPSVSRPNSDTEHLFSVGAAEVRSLNFKQLVGAGILHTKLWLVDRKTAYIGSANLDWRSLTQVKELGLYIENCSCLVEDIGKIFDVYWMLGTPDAVIPSEWPANVITNLNKDNTLPLKINTSNIGIYVSSSPPQICPPGRTTDIDAILDIISKAQFYIYISVMDYYPLIIFSRKPVYWSIIDDALRKAAINNNVEIRLLISWWKNSRELAKAFLRSLTALAGFEATKGRRLKISVKFFVVPSTEEQKSIPYARVNHNKFMITDKSSLIGTSNWSGDYFTSTAGVSVIVEGTSELHSQLTSVFFRDWNSEFAQDLSTFQSEPKYQPGQNPL